MHGIENLRRSHIDMINKKHLTFLIATLLSASVAHAGGEGWMSDFEAAKKKAAAEGKDLLIDFTGSDWCPPCKDLNKRILSQKGFQESASKNYILVELDYPRTEEGIAKISDETKAQNEKLQRIYQIQGFPTILLTDSEGRPFAQTGHRPFGPDQYLKHLAELQDSKVKRDAGFADAKSKKGLEKAKALFEGLSAVPEDHRRHYTEVIDEIKANDPDDSTGLVATVKKQEAMIALEKTLQTAMGKGDSASALLAVDEFIKTHKPEGEEKQQLLAIKLNVYYADENYEAMEKVIDQVIAVDAESRYAKQLASFKNGQLQELKKKAAEEKK